MQQLGSNRDSWCCSGARSPFPFLDSLGEAHDRLSGLQQTRSGSIDQRLTGDRHQLQDLTSAVESIFDTADSIKSWFSNAMTDLKSDQT